MLDLDALLAPIDGDSPGGASVRYEPVFDEIKKARQEDPELPQGEWRRERKVADWAKVVKLSTQVLTDRSKDLQVAAWLTEGLLRREGFAGLHSGMELLRRLHEEFWDDLHPELEEDDDLEFRAAPLEWVGQYLEPAVNSVPLNREGPGLIEYRESRKVGYEEEAEKDSSKKEARAQAIEEGRLTAEDFDEGFDATPKSWYKELAGDLERCQESLEALDGFCRERYGDVAPGFITLRESLSEVQRVTGRLLDRKLEQEPDPPEEEEQEQVAAAAEDGEAEAAASAPGASVAPAAGGGAAAAGAPTTPGAAAPPSRTLSSWDDAAALTAEAAAFMRKERPTSPTSYLMLRGLRWGELREGGEEVDPRLLVAPPTELRTRLKTLLLDGEWEELLEVAEQTMATEYGRGWLDLQRYVLTALDRLGDGYAEAAAAIRQALRALLSDVPELLDITLMDDSPTANRETLEWLNEVVLDGGEGTEGESLVLTERSRRREQRDAYARARDQVRSGDPREAVQLLMKVAAQERSSRDRFLRRSEATQIMVDERMDGVALPILQEMMEQIERHQLEEWEAGETVARAMANLYTCLERTAQDPAKKDDLYLRICRLDPLQGMHLRSGAGDGAQGAVREAAEVEGDAVGD